MDEKKKEEFLEKTKKIFSNVKIKNRQFRLPVERQRQVTYPYFRGRNILNKN